MDCDDIYYKNKILSCIENLEKNKDYDFIITNVNQIDEKNNIVGEFLEIDRLCNSGKIFKQLIIKKNLFIKCN